MRNKLRNVSELVILTVLILVTIIFLDGVEQSQREKREKEAALWMQESKELERAMLAAQEVTDPEAIVTAQTTVYKERRTACEDITKQQETPSGDPVVSTTDGYLLAKIAMAEAEGEDTTAKALVIRVVLNRVSSDRFPDSVEGVIFEKNQFSPVSDGRWDKVEPDDDCYVALGMVKGGWDESRGATYFELTSPHSTWHSRNLEKLFEYGVTTFYKEVVSLQEEK